MADVGRFVLALAAVGALALACGGRATGPGGDGSSGGASSSGASSSGSSSGASDDAGTCVNVDPADYDASCAVDADCTLIITGLVCSGQCGCGGNTPVNVAGGARFKAAVAGIDFLACPCVAAPPVRCMANRCTECDFGTQAPACRDGG